MKIGPREFIPLLCLCFTCISCDLSYKNVELAPGYRLVETDGPTVIVRTWYSGGSDGPAIVDGRVLTYAINNGYILVQANTGSGRSSDTLYYIIKILAPSTNSKEGVSGPMEFAVFDSIRMQLGIVNTRWIQKNWK